MAFEFKLPDLGEGVAEGEIVAWRIKEGDTIGEDQPLVEVMTDKATVEIPAPRAGTIHKIHFQAGQVVPVGTVIVAIQEAGSAAPAPAAATHAAPPTHTKTAAPAVAVAPAAVPSQPIAGRERVLATPATRKLARDLGVDLNTVAGSGPRGRVTKDDIRSFTAAPAAAPSMALSAPPRPQAPVAPRTAPAPAAPGEVLAPRSVAGNTTRVPFRGIRKKIAEQMVRSAYTAPHFTLVEEVDMSEVHELREKWKDRAEQRGIKLTYLPFVMKALSAALKQHPTLNSTLDETAGEQVIYSDVHVGFSLDTDRGLMVPVVFDTQRKSVLELGSDLQKLINKGRDGTIQREELSGSTITITSAGNIGGLFATPIINFPEVAILGVYRIEDRPVVLNGRITVRKMMYLSVTLDHRVVDGGEAARFLNTMKRLLGDPTSLILEG